MSEAGELVSIRVAVPGDIPALQAMIERSVRGLASRAYSSAEIEGSVGAVLGLDTQLIADRTYFVAVSADAIVASGGWSYRTTLCGADDAPGRLDTLLDPVTDAAKIRAIFVDPQWARLGLGSRMLAHCEEAALAAGFTRFEMGSTLSGVPLYQLKGYVEDGRFRMPLGNGAQLEIVHMTKAAVL